MNKRPFWRRVNRGAVLSLALLGLAVLYVLATQLMLLPAKQELRTLGESVHDLALPYLAPSDSELERLSDLEEAERAKEALEEKLDSLFVKDAQYLEQSAADILEMATRQLDMGMRLRSLQLDSVAVKNCTISEDTGHVQLAYRYRVRGQFYDYHTNGLTEESEEEMTLFITLACKQTDNDWRIHRVAHIAWDDSGAGYGLF